VTGIVSIDAATYHADLLGDQPTLSASIAKILVNQTPLHARAQHPRLNPSFERKTEEKFDLGVACHALLLEGRNAVAIVEHDSWRSNDSQTQRDEARANGQIPLLGKHWDELDAMCKAIREQLDALDVQPTPLTNGKPEQTLVWEDNGVLCRALVDWLHDDFRTIDDVKSTRASANPKAWKRTLFGIGAEIQAAMYRRAVKAIAGIDPEFRFIVCETTPPYAVSVVGLPPAALALANDKLDYALATWKRCLANDDWPGYPRQVCYVDTPSYVEYAWLEKEAMEVAA
jgi:hypothetical protein